MPDFETSGEETKVRCRHELWQTRHSSAEAKEEVEILIRTIRCVAGSGEDKSLNNHFSNTRLQTGRHLVHTVLIFPIITCLLFNPENRYLSKCKSDQICFKL